MRIGTAFKSEDGDDEPPTNRRVLLRLHTAKLRHDIQTSLSRTLTAGFHLRGIVTRCRGTLYPCKSCVYLGASN
jgi:hypothetical protein